MAVRHGQIYVHEDYYVDANGKFQPKFFLVVAAPANDDIVYRLLTSRQNGRPQEPTCYHGDPCPGFFLGEQLGGPLMKPTWLDLRSADDYEVGEFNKKCADNRIHFKLDLPRKILVEALRCTAQAPDTTRRQERHIHAVIDTLTQVS